MFEPSQDLAANDGPVHIGFLMMPHYTLITFANAVAVLRMANLKAQQELYRWSVLTMDGQAVCSSDGLELKPDCSVAESEALHMLFVCGGYKIEHQSAEPVLDYLRCMSRQHIPMGGMCTGAYLLAAAGLLNGYRCTIHWENLSSLRERFPQITATSSLFVLDRNRLTCSGGVSSMDMFLSIVSRLHGAKLVQEISEQFAHERVRTEEDAQRVPLRYLIGVNQPKLMDAVVLMEANIEEPLSLDDMASYLTVSRRQLERLFQKNLHCSPSRYYLELRLNRARQLLLQTSMPIIDVAISCGFSTSPHFSKCYSGQYGKPPRAERIAPALVGSM